MIKGNISNMNEILSQFNSVPIVIVPTYKRQNKTHKKKRINKKWAKRYGFTEYNTMEDGQVINMNGSLYMNAKTASMLKTLLSIKWI